MPGVRLALDWGKVRIGVAACDSSGLLAYPVETIETTNRPIERIMTIVTEYAPSEIVVGLPINLSGQYGPAAQYIITQVKVLAEELGAIPIRMVDERMSTGTASRRLKQAGKNTRSQRSIIDQAAAVEILQSALAFESRTGMPAGVALEEIDG